MPNAQAIHSEPLQRSQLGRETFCALALPELCLALPKTVLLTILGWVSSPGLLVRILPLDFSLDVNALSTQL